MFAADPLYGPVEIPDWLDEVLLTPEVQRLRDIRLINTTTPYLAALSETRRYTHTIGVVALALRVYPRLVGAWSKGERDALLVAAVLHDVGTPPFAHLFEYLLKAANGWTHESMLEQIVAGTYRPEDRYHQVYYGHGLKLPSLLQQLDVDPEVVVNYVMGRSPLGSLIAGRLDLDNIDNVYRMCSLLGFRPDVSSALALVDGLSADDSGMILDRGAWKPLQEWRNNRRRAYEILAFDTSSLQGQAMLTEALSFAVQNRMISEENWHMTDEALLTYLYKKGREHELLGRIVRRFIIGDYYRTIFIGWYDQAQGHDDLRLPDRRESVREKLESRLGFPCCPYIFYDNGTFEKELRLRHRDGPSTRPVTIGATSRSTVVSVFTPRAVNPTKRQVEVAIDVLSEFGLLPAALKTIPTKQRVYDFPGQAELPL